MWCTDCTPCRESTVMWLSETNEKCSFAMHWKLLIPFFYFLSFSFNHFSISNFVLCVYSVFDSYCTNDFGLFARFVVAIFYYTSFVHLFLFSCLFFSFLHSLWISQRVFDFASSHSLNAFAFVFVFVLFAIEVLVFEFICTTMNVPATAIRVDIWVHGVSIRNHAVCACFFGVVVFRIVQLLFLYLSLALAISVQKIQHIL